MSGRFAVLRRCGKRAAERLTASDDRLVALACTIVGAAAIAGALALARPADPTAAGAWLVARHFWPLAGAAAVLAVAPRRWHYALQTAVLAALFVIYQLEEPRSTDEKVVTIAMWAIAGLLVWKLPVKNATFRKSLVVGVTATLPILARRMSFEQGVVIIQFLFACAVVAKRESRGFLESLRATSSLRVVMPPNDLIASRRSGKTILLGAALVAGGVLGFRGFDQAARCGSSPFYFCAQSLSLSVADDVWLHPRLASFGWAVVRDALWLGHFALEYSVYVGLLNLLGVPLRFVTGNLLRVRNLFDYWKIANRWQYELLRAVYLDDFFAISRGLSAALGIVSVFLVSGLHHLPGRAAGATSLARFVAASEVRWLVLGVCCAVTYEWMVRRIRQRMRAKLAGVARSGSGDVAATLLAPLSFFAVLAVSGLLIAGDEVYGAVRPYWIVANTDAEGFRLPRFYTSLDYGGPIRPSERIDGAVTTSTPAMTSLGGDLYVAWRDASTAGVRWAKLADGTWSLPQTVGGATTDASPALGVHAGRLFLAWRGTGADAGVRWATLGGAGWSHGAWIDASSARGSPSLGAFDDRLYAMWATERDDAIAWASFDGVGWTAPRRIGEGVRGQAPALTEVDRRLYAAWRGVAPQEATLFWSVLDGDAWARPRAVPGAEAGSGPAIAALDGALAVAWRGVGLDADIQWATLYRAWEPPARTGLATCDRPALISHRGYAVFGWRGVEATRCEDPADFAGAWDLTSLHVVDVPRSSSDPRESLGRFTWRWLDTNDPDAAAAFYRDVVGWRVTGDRSSLTLANARGKLGGIARISDEDRGKGVLPHWTPTIAVQDVDATARVATAAGGRVYARPSETADGARFAVIGDPTGTPCLVSSVTGAATLHDSTAPGDFHGAVLTTPDPEASLRFYGELFSWRAGQQGDAFLELTRGRARVGAMRVVPGTPVAWWLFLIEVDDLDGAVLRAQSRGATVRSGPTPSPRGGRMAELVDPQGAPFGLHEAATDPR